MRRLSRRTLLAGSTVIVAAPVLPGQAQTAVARFGGVRADAAPLAARGAAGAAEAIARIMPEKLRIAFGDLVAPGARGLPVLVARIDTLFMADYAGSQSSPIFAKETDQMSGAGLVVQGQQVLSTTPLHVTLPPSYSGAWYLPDIDLRRIDSICYQFAYWLRREMQL